MLTASAAVPIWLLARRLLSPAWSLLVVLITLTSPYLWLQTMRPMSESAGIAVLWWYLWCWWRAMERRTWLSAILALFLFGVLMGVRLSFVPFGLSLVWLLGVRCADWRYEGKRLLPRVTVVLLAGGFQLLWVAGLALSEGGFVGFAELAAAFTEGHFSQWGGGVISAASVPLAERALRFAGDNLLWTGVLPGPQHCSRRRRRCCSPPCFARGRTAPRAAARAAARAARPLRRHGSAARRAGSARPARGRLWRLGAARAEHRQAAPHHAINWLDVAAAPRSVPRRTAGQALRAGIAQRRIADGAPAQASPSAARQRRSPRRHRRPHRRTRARCVPAEHCKSQACCSRPASSRCKRYKAAGLQHSKRASGQLFTSWPMPFCSQAAGGKAGSVVLYTWEETRVLDYLHTPVLQRRIETTIIS